MVSQHKKAKNHPVYAKDETMGCFSLAINPDFENEVKELTNEKQETTVPRVSQEEANKRWKLFFNGACSKEGSGARTIIISPEGITIPISHKLEFESTNNVAEYEALALGLKKARRMGIKNINIYGDSELIVQQVNKSYQTKHPHMRSF